MILPQIQGNLVDAGGAKNPELGPTVLSVFVFNPKIYPYQPTIYLTGFSQQWRPDINPLGLYEI